MKKIILSFILLTLFFPISFITFAQESFIVQDIQIRGLKRIKKETVYEHIPIKVGQTISLGDSTRIINALYKTGFFDDIQVLQEKQNLIIQVLERPTIASIKIKGNKDVSKEQLKKTLQQLGLQKGQIFDNSMLDRVKQALKSQYISKGKYNIKIDTTLKTLSDNRVNVEVLIDEGAHNKIRQIRIIGNKAFGERTLISQMYISTPGLLTFFTSKDKYTKEKMDASLEALKLYYYNHGYARFRVESSQVSLKPGTSDIYITIKIHEGDVYKISGYQFSGYTVLPEASLKEMVDFKAGDIFSQEKIMNTVTKLYDLLANKGYSFSSIEVKPEYYDEKRLVSIIFFIQPGRPIYVRRINIQGNHKTNDDVIRRALRQPEGELLASNKILESQRQLRLLTYIEDVKFDQQPVDHTNNQVDLNLTVSETRSAEISAGIGIGTNGPEFNAGVNQPNLFGTGSMGGIYGRWNSWGKMVSVNYFNPYYTHSGIGRGFRFYFEQQNPGGKFLGFNINATPFTTDRFGLAVNYNFPLSDTHSFQAGIGYEFLKITSLGRDSFTNRPSTQIDETTGFAKRFGRVFPQVRLTTGWTNSHFDRLPFPIEGWHMEVEGSVALPGGPKGLTYYKVGTHAKGYYPLLLGFLVSVEGGVHYGDGFGHTSVLPFYENFYAGGIGSTGQVRGFDTASLGPKDSNNVPFGGNFAVHSSVGLILPKPISGEAFRTTLFVDAGNVYNTKRNNPLTGHSPGHIRLSTGIAVEWRTPFGLIVFSLAKPLNKITVKNPTNNELIKRLSDSSEFFQFTMSHGF